MEPGLEIAGSARRHGIGDEDVRHAARMAIREVDQGDRVLLIGPDRSGKLLGWWCSTQTTSRWPFTPCPCAGSSSTCCR